MRAIFKIAIVAVSLIIINTGCERSLNNTSQVFTIKAGLSEDAETKSGLNTSQDLGTWSSYIYWTSQDKIGVFVNGDINNENIEFSQKSGTLSADGKHVVFEGALTGIQSDDNRTIYTYFPYDNNATISGSELTINFPHNQAYTDIDKLSDLPAVGKYNGKAGDMDMTFNNLWTILAISLYYNTPGAEVGPMLSSIIFEANPVEGEKPKIAGTMTIDMSAATLVPNYDNFDQETITVNFSTPVEINSAQPYVYIAIPSIVYEAGFNVTFVTDMGNHTAVRGSKADCTGKMNSIWRNQGYITIVPVS